MGCVLIMTKGMILVTGCSGLVGTHLCNKLEDYGYSVVGVDVKWSDALPDGDRFIFHNIDLRDSDEVNVLFDQYEFDGVINAFGIKGSPLRAKERPIDFLEPSIKVNTNTTRIEALSNTATINSCQSVVILDISPALTILVYAH